MGHRLQECKVWPARRRGAAVLSQMMCPGAGPGPWRTPPPFCAFHSCRDATYLIPEALSEHLQPRGAPSVLARALSLCVQSTARTPDCTAPWPRGRPCLSTDRCLAACVATLVRQESYLPWFDLAVLVSALENSLMSALLIMLLFVGSPLAHQLRWTVIRCHLGDRISEVTPCRGRGRQSSVACWCDFEGHVFHM